MSEEKAVEQVTSVSLSDGAAEEAKKVILICRDRKEAEVVLVCRDGTEIYMDNETALMSDYLNTRLYLFRRCYGNGNGNDRVKLNLSKFEKVANIPSYLVEKVFRYCHRHAHPQPHQDLEAFDAQFYNDVDVDYSEFCRLHKTAMRFGIECLRRLGIAACYHITRGEYLRYQDLFSLPF